MNNAQQSFAQVSNDHDSALDDFFHPAANEPWILKGDSICTDDTALESFDPTTAYDAFNEAFHLERLQDKSLSRFDSLEDNAPLHSVTPTQLQDFLCQEEESYTFEAAHHPHQPAAASTDHKSVLKMEPSEEQHFWYKPADFTTSSSQDASSVAKKNRVLQDYQKPAWKNEEYVAIISSPDDTFVNRFSNPVNSCQESDDSEQVSDRNSGRSCISWDKQQKEFAKPPKTANICLNDLKKVFHLERPQAEKALNLKRTTFSNLSRHFGISKWPYRTIRDVENRQSANTKTLREGGISNDKRRKLLEQQENLKKVIDLIYSDPTISKDSNTLAVLLKMVEPRKKGERFC